MYLVREMLDVSALLCWLFCCILASPIYITSDGDTVVDTSLYGVNIRLTPSVAFKVKACSAAHIRLGDGTSDGSYEVVLGGWNNQFFAFRECNLCGATTQKFAAAGLLDCNQYRSFWLSWYNGEIQFGRGCRIHLQTIFTVTPVSGHSITTLGAKGFTGFPAAYIFEDIPNLYFKATSLGGRYSNGLLVVIPKFGIVLCASTCLRENQCLAFSSNANQSKCELYDKTANSSLMIAVTAWSSFEFVC